MLQEKIKQFELKTRLTFNRRESFRNIVYMTMNMITDITMLTNLKEITLLITRIKMLQYEYISLTNSFILAFHSGISPREKRQQ